MFDSVVKEMRVASLLLPPEKTLLGNREIKKKRRLECKVVNSM